MKKITKKFVKEQVGGLVDRYFIRGINFRNSKNKYEQTALDLIWDSDSNYSSKTEFYRDFFEKLGMGVKRLEKKEGKNVIVNGKKIIVRFLDADVKYKVIDTFLTDGSICENCGRKIKNIIVVEDANGNRFDVGSECIHTVELYDDNEKMRLAQKLKEMRTLMKVRTELRKAFKTKGLVFRKDEDTVYIWVGREYDKETMGSYYATTGNMKSEKVMNIISEFVNIDDVEFANWEN